MKRSSCLKMSSFGVASTATADAAEIAALKASLADQQAVIADLQAKAVGISQAALDAAVNAESAARVDADNNEALSRANADSALGSRIDAWSLPPNGVAANIINATENDIDYKSWSPAELRFAITLMLEAGGIPPAYDPDAWINNGDIRSYGGNLYVAIYGSDFRGQAPDIGSPYWSPPYPKSVTAYALKSEATNLSNLVADLTNRVQTLEAKVG